MQGDWLMLLNVEININYATYSFDNYEVARLIAHSRMAAIGNDERKTKKQTPRFLLFPPVQRTEVITRHLVQLM